MNQYLITSDLDHHSAHKLQELYDVGLIPAEKKPFLIDANQSIGGLLKVQEGDCILDLASQIASVGLGFNAGPLFGTAQFLESWIGHTDTPTARGVRSAFEQLLQKLIGSSEFQAQFCSSGAEAIEHAIGICFSHFNGQRRKILAFENSFHGRMLVALSCTYAKSKREPFAWPQFATEFVPFPEWMEDDVNTGVARPGQSGLTENEIDILRLVEQRLANDEFMLVMLEPMQCEGGERYSSARFHQELFKLCCKFGVPLVYDEIQTGFGLGRHFFWHRGFALQDELGRSAFPHIVVGAKKAQVGYVLSRLPLLSGATEQYNFASLMRGYLQASILDQFSDQVTAIEDVVRSELIQLVQSFPDLISRPRAQGLSFAFDFVDAASAKRFVELRFEHGLLYYPAGEKTARFRLNLSFQRPQIEFSFAKLRETLGHLLGRETDATANLKRRDVPAFKSTTRQAKFHLALIETKRDFLSKGKRQAVCDNSAENRFNLNNSAKLPAGLEYLRQELSILEHCADATVELLNKQTYQHARDEIAEIQTTVYEPVRQTPLEDFDTLFESPDPLAIVVRKQGRIIAMAFAGRLGLFHKAGGVEQDPFVNDPNVFYMLDLTVMADYRGGLGSAMKQALTLIAAECGVTAIHGRNRDHLARGMWAINLSLGSYAMQVLKDSYADDSPFRDCLYYRCETNWGFPTVKFCSGADCPLGPLQLSHEFCQRNLGVLVNKLTHSNFITCDMVDELPIAFRTFGPSLRHGYTSSSLSEAVDKLVKVLWLKRATRTDQLRPRTKILAIAGSDWGTGSCFTRSLSGLRPAFFEIEFMDPPSQCGPEAFIDQLSHRLNDDYLAVFVEPLIKTTMERLDERLLNQLIQVCRQVGVPVVYNETTGQFYRYSLEHFSASNVPGIEPDCAVSFLGGQMALIGVRQEWFVTEPLMLISTWDGDAFSLARYVAARRWVDERLPEHQRLVAAFTQKMTNLLDKAGSQYDIRNGVGWCARPLPHELTDYLQVNSSGRALICPAYWQMQAILKLD
ncbi:MAG TPA: aminotransferase class III-fold pyridoxal phosphate-dependent enzyme [Pirellulaceae bacterium]|nr:aminotransferase class III-fold pyridoxal phosphate-dependent enzyme [Pirellulaceae bacterium]HMO92148.1 aminotransferase class III-fold pyridoxal phosphate-dependent enzyme [Pirellulaceae bacterium]HMP68927.1 aminotransferase class III-fold pyridoxal phosphate-dependent enzyme [Pirellulaceae bacterium]